MSIRAAITRLSHVYPKGSPERQALLRYARSIHEEQVNRALRLDQVDPVLAKIISQSGDGNKDKVNVSRNSWSASSLKPSQTSMVLPKAVGMALGMLASGKVGGDLGAIVSADRHIMDGHHRWAATILASGSKGKVGGWGAALEGKELLRLLNILTKGLFGVRNGKPGKGNLDDFTPAKVSALLQKFSVEGIGGSFPISAEKVQGILIDNFGSVGAGIEQMGKNASLISKSVPSWAPPRKQMPVIDPQNVPKAVRELNQGKVDWTPPFKQALDKAASLPVGSSERREILQRLAGARG